jgi:translation initiation factor RLI1
MSPQSTDQRLIKLDVRAASFDQEAQFLSGGNQQKALIARWLARDPDILIFCEPTRGVEVAAKAAIYKIMRDLAKRGRAILMISSDLPEIIGVSDRILKGEPVVGPYWKLPQPVIMQADLDKYVDDKVPPLHYALCGCKDLPGYPQAWGGK